MALFRLLPYLFVVFMKKFDFFPRCSYLGWKLGSKQM